MNVKYNIVSNDQEQSSVTVFFGRDILLATKDHPNFGRIVNALETGEDNIETLHGLFDVGVGIVKNFQRLSERVTVTHGKLYLDGDEMDTALTQAILRFHAEGNDDFKPLVAFLEKLQQNPNPVSVQQLFRWLRDKHYAFAPDGDFIAYKGVRTGTKGVGYESINAGTAFVNGEVMKGSIPNKPDTIIEMPRSQVTFDPKQGCSTGLHAGNWRYAKEFSQGAVLRVKINPRDVVSVPTDSNDEKLRVCRYKVLNIVTAEDTQSLFVPDLERTAKVVTKPAPPKPVLVPAAAPIPQKPKGKATRQHAYPEYYEQFTKRHFEQLTVKELTWLAKEWELEGITSKTTKAVIIVALVKEARARKKTWA